MIQKHNIPFTFVVDAHDDAARDHADVYKVKVSTGLESKEDLLHVLFKILRFPGYFGFNWDALADCLTDLTWLTQHTVVIVHNDLPAIACADTLIYLETLAEAVEHWDNDNEHRLQVIFPDAVRSQIVSLLNA